MRISDWRSYVCSSDLLGVRRGGLDESTNSPDRDLLWIADPLDITSSGARKVGGPGRVRAACQQRQENSNFSPKDQRRLRSEEHTSELQSLMRSSYAVFCLQQKKHTSY